MGVLFCEDYRLCILIWTRHHVPAKIHTRWCPVQFTISTQPLSKPVNHVAFHLIYHLHKNGTVIRISRCILKCIKLNNLWATQVENLQLLKITFALHLTPRELACNQLMFLRCAVTHCPSFLLDTTGLVPTEISAIYPGSSCHLPGSSSNISVYTVLLGMLPSSIQTTCPVHRSRTSCALQQCIDSWRLWNAF